MFLGPLTHEFAEIGFEKKVTVVFVALERDIGRALGWRDGPGRIKG